MNAQDGMASVGAWMATVGAHIDNVKSVHVENVGRMVVAWVW